ncbi:hypothetical protein BH10CHL1_BH10CHL1_06810 [soil metagenome]
MSRLEAQINFCLPRHRWPVVDIPSSITTSHLDEYAHFFFNGPWLSWTLQTYLRLREFGFKCSLVDSTAHNGILIVARCDLPFDYVPQKKQFVASIISDGGWQPFTQVQIVQNPSQIATLPNAYFMPHWTQPGLIRRDPMRMNKFENVAFFGHPDQLSHELKQPEWISFLKSHGLKWHAIHQDSPRKNDYNDIDLIVAIRSFDSRCYDNKPATKLYNAWHAEIPAILGVESAYQAERKTVLDYCEVSSYEDLCQTIIQLANWPERRRAMMNNARQRAQETSNQSMIKRWQSLIEDILIPQWQEWQKSTVLHQKMFFLDRWLKVRWNGLQNRFTAG